MPRGYSAIQGNSYARLRKILTPAVPRKGPKLFRDQGIPGSECQGENRVFQISVSAGRREKKSNNQEYDPNPWNRAMLRYLQGYVRLENPVGEHLQNFSKVGVFLASDA